MEESCSAVRKVITVNCRYMNRVAKFRKCPKLLAALLSFPCVEATGDKGSLVLAGGDLTPFELFLGMRGVEVVSFG